MVLLELQQQLPIGVPYTMKNSTIVPDSLHAGSVCTAQYVVPQKSPDETKARHVCNVQCGRLWP